MTATNGVTRVRDFNVETAPDADADPVWDTIVTVSDPLTTGAESVNPSLSFDGRFIVFESTDETLVSGDNNGQRDIFVKDLLSGETTLVSVSSDGVQGELDSGGATISADGRFVAFVVAAPRIWSMATPTLIRMLQPSIAQPTPITPGSGDAARRGGRAPRALRDLAER
ncbi:MAG: hypothetical protein R3D30_10795 [Hyphomicrobiales bacterium]